MKIKILINNPQATGYKIGDIKEVTDNSYYYKTNEGMFLLKEKEGEWFEKVTDLLEEARRRYPVGTKFRCALNPIHQDEVTEENFAELRIIGGDIDSPGMRWLYHSGTWAEIISSTPTAKFYIGQEVVTTDKGYYFCRPDVPNASCKHGSSYLKNQVKTILKRQFNTVWWYQYDPNDNWHTEDHFQSKPLVAEDNSGSLIAGYYTTTPPDINKELGNKVHSLVLEEIPIVSDNIPKKGIEVEPLQKAVKLGKKGRKFSLIIK